MPEYIVRLAWGDNNVAIVVAADSPEAAERIAADDPWLAQAPIGTPMTVTRFVPSRTVESDGTVTIRRADA